MLEIEFYKEATRFIKKLPEKHQRQIAAKIIELRTKNGSHDSKQLIGFPFLRADVGEYRIIYQIEGDVLLIIILVGKRNDGDVYKKLDRKMSG